MTSGDRFRTRFVTLNQNANTFLLYKHVRCVNLKSKHVDIYYVGFHAVIQTTREVWSQSTWQNIDSVKYTQWMLTGKNAYQSGLKREVVAHER